MNCYTVCWTRIILDRASSGLDPLTSPVCMTSVDRHSDPLRLEQKPSLTDILNNIQSLRRFCYRPRRAQGHREQPQGEGSRPRCGLSAGCSSAPGVFSGDSSTPSDCPVLTQQHSPCTLTHLSCFVPAGGITEEQYHSHRQQLVQMRQQQLQSCRTSNGRTATHLAQVTARLHYWTGTSTGTGPGMSPDDGWGT